MPEPGPAVDRGLLAERGMQTKAVHTRSKQVIANAQSSGCPCALHRCRLLNATRQRLEEPFASFANVFERPTCCRRRAPVIAGQAAHRRDAVLLRVLLCSRWSLLVKSCWKSCSALSRALACNSMTAAARTLLEDDFDQDDQVDVHRNDAFDRRYLDERSWEALKEDEHGRLVASSHVTVQRKRARPEEGGQRLRRGLMRCASQLSG
jgi:hypothetical protein